MAINPPVKRVNWPEVFVAYCNSCPVDEIAQVYDIELSTLQAYVTTQGWAKLRASIPQAQLTAGEKTSAKLAVIEQNRAENLRSWVELRDQLVDVIKDLRSGKLKFEKLFHNKGFVVRDEIGPTTGDLVNITTAMRTVSDGTYRALGDFQASDKGGQDGAANSQGAAPAITIILPGVISAPRELRASVDVQAEVIDLRLPSESPKPSDTGFAPLP